jgi:hypothetical protein
MFADTICRFLIKSMMTTVFSAKSHQLKNHNQIAENPFGFWFDAP